MKLDNRPTSCVRRRNGAALGCMWKKTLSLLRLTNGNVFGLSSRPDIGLTADRRPFWKRSLQTGETGRLYIVEKKMRIFKNCTLLNRTRGRNNEDANINEAGSLRGEGAIPPY